MDGVRNVVLVTVDCLRADHLPCYGYNRKTAPFLSDLARRSTVFETGYSTGPGTSVAFPSIFTGTYPFEYGGYGTLAEERTPIAEVLSAAGFETVGVHSNTYLSRTFGYQRGFDRYESFYDRPSTLVRLEQAVGDYLGDGPFSRLIRRGYEAVVDDGGNESDGERLTLPYEQADYTTETALDLLAEAGAPFFLWTHYMDVHAPHHPPDRHFEPFGGDPPDWSAHNDRWLAAKEYPSEATDADRRQFVDAYDAEVRFVDEQLERLFEGIEDLGHYGDTLYLVTADHGELLGEHGGFSHPPRLHEELLRVPLLAHIPNVTDGTRAGGVASVVDLPSTIADALGVSTPPTDRGESLLPALGGGEASRQRAFGEVCHRPGEGFSGGEYVPDKAIVACRTEEHRYVRDRQHDDETFAALDGSSVGEQQRRDLRAWVDDHLATVVNEDATFDRADIDETTAQRLRDLGYME